MESAEGTRRVGLLLGYPPCCVDAFVAASGSAAAGEAGINEAAIRSTAGLDGEIPWEMNTLSHMSPVGFTPCRAGCPGALAFARRLLDALGRADPAGLAVVERVLRRPVLFFRYPILYVLDGAPAPARAVDYAAALPNDDASGLPAVLAAWQEDELGSALAAGDRVELSGGALAVRRAGAVVAAWELCDARVPMLLRFV